MNALDARIFEHVRLRHGVISLAELRALGASPDAIRHRIRSEMLRPVFRRAYIVSGHTVTGRARMLAATHACGLGAVVSHLSAAILWGLIRGDGTAGPVAVTVPRQVRPVAGVELHRSRVERTTHFGIPVTPPARTLLDIAPSLTKRRLSRAIRQAEVTGLVKHEALMSLASSSSPGVRALRAALAPVPTPTRSTLEDDIVDVLRELHGTPRFEPNARVAGHEVDIFVPSQSLVIELDGGRWHATPQARHEDALKQQALERAGLRVKRVRGE